MYGETEKLAPLVGRRVEALHVSPGEADLYVTTDAGVFKLGTDGDCCSESWWADAIGVKQLLGETIREAAEIDIPQPEDVDARTRQECDVVYGVRMTTIGGACDLIFRNSSNGYYGGSCFLNADEALPADAVAITGDWSA